MDTNVDVRPKIKNYTCLVPQKKYFKGIFKQSQTMSRNYEKNGNSPI